MIGDEVQVCVLPVDCIEPLYMWTVRNAMFAWYALLFRSAINLWNMLNLWSAFPLRYVEDDICVICVNFLNLGDEGLE